MSFFKFSDYDCIGFDLDSTIIQYNIKNLVLFEYEVITNFLINARGYSKKLKEPLRDQDIDFLQKGLFFDFEQGNIVKLTPEGNVYQASHGTKSLSSEEIEKYYPNRKWSLGQTFVKDPLITWNGPLSEKIRTLLDVFDMPAGLVFARAVDSLDEKNGKPLDKYKIWPDILDAFVDMYSRERFQSNEGHFFCELKANPSKYIHKCPPEVLLWIRKLKEENKKTFLITGSNSDFVELTTGYAFGDDWKSLFDIIVCYARKPGFFTQNRPFFSIQNYYEDKKVTSEELKVGKTYNQGNWRDLKSFFSRITEKKNPKCLYVGDNFLQDIYAPSKFTDCDTMAISDEQLAERLLDHDVSHNHEFFLKSKAWGSFFSLKTPSGYHESFWNHLIKKHSKICIPQLLMVAERPIDEPIKCFPQKDDDKELCGYYPAKPVTLTVQHL